MKRGNIILLADIVVIVLCLIVRLFSDYPAWSTIVPAVTISSSMFSLSDLFTTLSQALSKKGDVLNETVSVLNTNSVCDIDPTLRDKYDKSFLETIEIFQNKLNNFNKHIINIQNSAVCFSIISSIFAFIGFTLLMCIIIFSHIAAVLIEIQDILSVLAFAVILMSQYIGTVLAETIEKDTSTADKSKKLSIKLIELLDEYERLLRF